MNPRIVNTRLSVNAYNANVLQLFTRELMNEGDNPPLGGVLCADKSDALVRCTLPEGNDQIFAAKY